MTAMITQIHCQTCGYRGEPRGGRTGQADPSQGACPRCYQVAWSKRFEPAVAFMQQHCTRQPALKEIARQAGLSECYFDRIFHAVMGETPKRMLSGFQIEHAKRLLRKDVKLRDVAQQCGFAHCSHFCSRFKQIEGLTPTQWMKKNG